MKKLLLLVFFALGSLINTSAISDIDLLRNSISLFQNKYYKEHVWDVQRSPAYPVAGSNWRLSNFKNPFDRSTSNPIDWGTNNDRYLMFDIAEAFSTGTGYYSAFNYKDDIKNTGDYALVLCLYEADGTFVKRICEYSQIYGFGDVGFVAVQEAHYGTLFTNEGFTTGATVNYIPTIGATTNLSELGDYTYAPVPTTGISKPSPSVLVFPYNGTSQGPAIPENENYTISGILTAVNIGTYSITISLNDPITTTWVDGTTDDIVLNWGITKGTYNMSSARWNYTDQISYDGTEKTVSVTGLPTGVTVSSYTGNTGTNTGTYTAQVTLSYDDTNYNAPSISDLNWTIAKATYNMSAAQWNYTSPFIWDGTEKTVSVTGLPTGVTVSSYTGNQASQPGDYTANAVLGYDTDNYNAVVMPDLSWSIVADFPDLNIVKLWDNVLAVSNSEKLEKIEGAEFKWYRDGQALSQKGQYIYFSENIPAGTYTVEILIGGTVAESLTYTIANNTQAIAYPNPVRSGSALTVDLGEQRPDDESADVVSLAGFPVNASVVKQGSSYMISGLNTPGTYFVRVFTADKTVSTLKVVVR